MNTISSQEYWARALNGVKTGFKFNEPRYEIMARIVKMELPHVPFFSEPLEVFLERKEMLMDSIVASLRYSGYHVYVDSLVNRQGPVMRYKDVTRKDLYRVCKKLECLKNPERFQLTMSVAPKLVFHGSVIITEKGTNAGSVSAEFVSGEAEAVTRGGAVPKFCISQDVFLGRFIYTFPEKDIRELLYESLRILPRTGDSYLGREEFASGYYEIGITETVPRFFIHDVKPWSD